MYMCRYTTQGSMIACKTYIKFGCHAYHGFSEVGADLGQGAGVREVGDGLDHGLGSLLRIPAFEDPGAHKHSVHSQLHQQPHIRWGGWEGGVLHVCYTYCIQYVITHWRNLIWQFSQASANPPN